MGSKMSTAAGKAEPILLPKLSGDFSQLLLQILGIQPDLTACRQVQLQILGLRSLVSRSVALLFDAWPGQGSRSDDVKPGNNG